jgi:hypothetical protein
VSWLWLCKIGLHAWFNQVVTMGSWRPYDRRVCERCDKREDHPNIDSWRRTTSPPKTDGGKHG